MAEVLICPKGSITPQSVKALAKAGVVVVQSDSPERCKFIRAGESISSNDMLWAAMKALQSSTYSGADTQRQAFTKIFWELVNEQYERRRSKPLPPLEQSEASK